MSFSLSNGVYVPVGMVRVRATWEELLFWLCLLVLFVLIGFALGMVWGRDEE